MYKNFQSCQKKLDGIQAIDYFLAKQLCQSIPSANDDQQSLLFHSIIATSEALRDGHTCLKLSELSELLHWQNPEENKPGYQFPDMEFWENYLSKTNINPENNHPLIYEYNRLYLRRYWQFEDELANSIRLLMNNTLPLDMIQGRNVIHKLFLVDKEQMQQVLDWQKIAVANALGRQFTIIAGGPGTGKTFTVTKLLAALQLLTENNLHIAMVAPTGKAAQRLNESIQKAKSYLCEQKLISDETLDSIPDTASTLHRLLGVKPGSHDFRYNENRQLPFDVILVDEISMIDLPLMSRLLRAINNDCRLIMLGDADQLPSVAAGSVLSDLAPQQEPGYSKVTAQQLNDLTGFDIPVSDNAFDHLTVLQKSHRFDGGGEIGQLARQVISGEAEQSWNFLSNGKEQIAKAHLLPETLSNGKLSQNYSRTFSSWLSELVEQYYVPLFSNTLSSNTLASNNDLTIEQAFEQLNQFRFLAATRMGEQGVTRINEYIEQYLRNRGLITTHNEYYPGRPIMVTENNYHVGLYNGDTGLLWNNEQGKLQAAFPQTNQSTESDSEAIRWLSIGRLPAIETVYSMTIHKTQGSEFTHVALVLPQQDSPILSRELLYTGITRASDQLTVWSDKNIWELGVKRKVQRYSGLQWRVFGNDFCL